ncbi:MAG: FecR domain-containing protein [Brachymonas sp.]|nr:FecR domain-containing protein [Brachymonas sp.]
MPRLLRLRPRSLYWLTLCALGAMTSAAQAQSAAPQGGNSAADPSATPAALEAAQPAASAASASAAATPAAARGSSLPHVVKPGDTLAAVCKQFQIASSHCLQAAYFNKLDGQQLPAPGSTIHIPLNLLPAKPQQARLIQTAGKVQINGQDARAGLRLDESSRIAAEADSSAVVELADGSRITVLPSSVADIVHSRHYTAPDDNSSGKLMQWIGSKIRLVQGAIESAVKKKNTANADAHKPVEVETVTSLIGVRGTRFRVATADSAVPHDRAEVLQGSVSNINTWKHSEIVLQAGQGAVVDPNKAQMQASTLLPAPTVPTPGQVLRRPQAVWSFRPVPGAVAYRIMAASDEAFDAISYSEKTSAPQADLSRLGNGIWHVRARAIDAQGLEGFDATSRIDLRPPAWVLRNASVQNAQGHWHLQWTAIATADLKPLPGATTVALDVARSPDFAAPLASLHTTGQSIPLPRLGLGRYYLRMAVDNASIKNKEQQVFLLHIPATSHHASYNLLLQDVPQPQ